MSRNSSSGDSANAVSNPALLDELAADMAAREQWREAAALARQAADGEPKNLNRWIDIARWLHRADDGAQAQNVLIEALRRNRRGAASLLLPLRLALAELQFDADAWPECIATCEAILRVDGRRHSALEMLVTAQMHEAQFEAATATMRRLLTLSPRDPLHRMRLGSLLQAQGKTGEALSEFERVVAIAPETMFAGDAMGAIEMLDRAQIQQVLMRAAESTIYGIALQRDLDRALDDSGYYLSENGRETLRQMVWDGRDEDDAPPEITRVH